jgi:biotin transport system substrate-specific component
MRHVRWNARDLALVAVFAALIAVLGLPGTITPFGNTVPITAQTLGVMLAGSVLGARRGAAAVAVFLVLVAAGLPLLAGGRGGLRVFAGPSAGFLIGWLAGAAAIGLIMAARPAGFGPVGAVPTWRAMFWTVLALVLGGIVLIYAIGIPVQVAITGVPLAKAAALSTLFLPGDALKVALAAVVAHGVFRGYPAVLERPRIRETAS